MTLYTIMPEEVVFDGMEDADYSYTNVRWNGMDLQVQLMDSAQARIVRLYSTNLYDYLKPELAPGSVINLVPKL